jgi:hypothetical protein
MKIDKSKLKDSSGRPLTQSLFLENGYQTEFAIYTLKDDDHKHKNGVTYPSLKKLFLEMEDVTEYEFANEYLLGWSHWKRLNKNKLMTKHFEEWREELELRLRAQGIRAIIDQSADDKGFQAAKYLAEKGWDKRPAGRPSKNEQLKEERMQVRMDDEFKGDIARMADYKKK